MHNIGYFKGFDSLNEKILPLMEGALIEDTDEAQEEKDLKDVSVPSLETEKFVSPTKSKEVAAGNTPAKTEVKEPQLGSVDTIAPRVEAFSDNEAIDDEAMDRARKEVNINDKVANFFNDSFDGKFTPKTKPHFDNDSSHVKNIVSDKPIRKIPAGW